MLKHIIVTGAVILFSGIFSFTLGQASIAAKATLVPGDITAIAEKKITINTAKGPVEVMLDEKTDFKLTSPEKPSVTTATEAAFSDAAVGDKVIVSGFPSADGKSMPARTVYLMKKAAISQKHAKEAAEWRMRGIAGKVKAVNIQTGQITVEVRNLTGSTDVTVTPKSDAKYKRYAQDSIRYDEAKDSSLSEVQVGDMVRALGDKSSDGSALAAEQVVTGAFQTIAGTVKSIDTEKNEVVIKNLVTNKDVTITVGETSVLKRYPQEMAEQLAAFQMGGNGPRPVGQPGPPQGNRPPGQPPGQPQGERQVIVMGGNAGGQPGAGRTFGGPGMRIVGGPGAGGGNIDDMLERFPNIKVADLKAGDMIALSSSKSASTDRIKAIKLLAGVEPFLRMAAGPGRGRGGQGGGVDGGFSIPGLDSIGFP